MADSPVIVRATIKREASPATDFGRTLYLCSATGVESSRVGASRIRSAAAYSDAADVAASGAGADERSAAAVYFAQAPFPRPLLLGYVILTAQPTLVSGAQLDVVAAEALGDDVAMSIGSAEFTVDLDGASTGAAVATALASAVNGASGITGASVSFANGRLDASFPTGLDVGEGFGGDAALTLGLTGPGSLTLPRVAAAETITTALDRIEASGQPFYWVVPCDAVSDDDDLLAIASWVSSRTKQAMFDLSGVSNLDANESASVGAQLFALGYGNVSAIYNGAAKDNKALSFVARFSSVNLEQGASLITGKFKSLPGTTPNPLTTAQRNELRRKKVNFYTYHGALADTAEGTTFGTWIDVRLWLDWFQSSVQNAILTALRSSRVSQTDSGVSHLTDAVSGVCERGVSNGGIAANVVSPSMAAEIRVVTGNADFDGFLSSGYLVHAGRVADQAQSDRDDRKSPPIKIFVKGSGAVHFLEANISFEG